jgi:regulator of sirC expression with transglutaminase-like and TPR domain
MFHNELRELTLAASRKASGPKPSYQPAVERLEERIVLNGNVQFNPIQRASQILQEQSKLQELADRQFAKLAHLVKELLNNHATELQVRMALQSLDETLARERGLGRAMDQVVKANPDNPRVAARAAFFSKVDAKFAADRDLSNYLHSLLG